MDDITKAKIIIEGNNYLTLSTCSGGIPWGVPLYYVCDEHYRFYWYSLKTTRHSHNLYHNPHVSCTIFNSTATEDETGGVYMEGVAKEVEASYVDEALRIYCSKLFAHSYEEKKQMLGVSQDFLGDSIFRMYVFTPSKMYVSGVAENIHGKWIDKRIEIALTDL